VQIEYNKSTELYPRTQAAEPIAAKKSVVMAIIPAYNEAKNISKMIEQTIKYVDSIIVVDDGSRDNTAELASVMNVKNVKVIRNINNMGKGAALKKGLVECCKDNNVDIVITLDADGQHDPADIPHLLKPIEKGEADIVIGSRYMQNPHEIPKLRRIGLSVIDYMNRYFMKTTIRDSQSGFRAYKKNVLNIISSYHSRGYGVETEQLATAESYGLRIVEVPINIKYSGLLNTSKRNSVLHGANILSTILKIAVERRPLLFFGLAGIVLFGIAIITAFDMLIIFNTTRYFSIPLALITLGHATIGSLLMIASLIFHVFDRIRDRYGVPATFSDMVNEIEK
jgi:glycosyltransferase involved in cell wall biosynthesis